MTSPASLVAPCESWEPIWCDLSLLSAPPTGWPLAAATHVLWALSGRQFGGCTVTLRPCRRSCQGNAWPFDMQWWEFGQWPRPVLFDGAWLNIACGSCGDSCSCSALEEVILPAPVYQVTQVKIGGVALAANAWRLDNRRILLRTDGERWPACQDLAAPDTVEGSWSVTVVYGEPVPELGQRAVGELAEQFALACAGSGDCRLPQSVQSVSRQGVDFTFIDPNQLLADGRIGLFFPDLFIQTTNPHRVASRARIFDLDGPAPRYPNI